MSATGPLPPTQHQAAYAAGESPPLLVTPDTERRLMNAVCEAIDDNRVLKRHYCTVSEIISVVFLHISGVSLLTYIAKNAQQALAHYFPSLRPSSLGYVASRIANSSVDKNTRITCWGGFVDVVKAVLVFPGSMTTENDRLLIAPAPMEPAQPAAFIDFFFTPLSDRQLHMIDSFFGANHGNDMCFAKLNGKTVNLRALETLQPQALLNGDIINYLMEMLRMIDAQIHGRESLLIPSTFWMPLIKTRGTHYVANFLTAQDMLTKEKFIWPLHVDDSHWILASISMAKKTITIYDSCANNDNREHGKDIAHFIASTVCCQCPQARDDYGYSKWDIHCVNDRNAELPFDRQLNGTLDELPTSFMFRRRRAHT